MEELEEKEYIETTTDETWITDTHGSMKYERSVLDELTSNFQKLIYDFKELIQPGEEIFNDTELEQLRLILLKGAKRLEKGIYGISSITMDERNKIINDLLNEK